MMQQGQGMVVPGMRGPQYRTLYASHVQVVTSDTEMRCMFGDILLGNAAMQGSVSTLNSPGIELHSSIILSHALAKEFYRILGEQIAEFEKRAGAIRTPTMVLPGR